MALFRFENTIKDSDLVYEVSHFIDLLDARQLEEKISRLEARMDANPFARYLLADKHKIDISIWDSVKALRTSGSLPSYRDPNHNRAFTFIFVFNRVHSFLSAKARKRLIGSFGSGLGDESDLDSLERELITAAHLVNLGGEIEYHDLEFGGYDFLCLRDNLEFEIECKTISADKGRQIHQHDLLRLSDHLNPDIALLTGQPNGFGTIVSVTVPSRLSRVPTVLKALAADIERAFSSLETITTDEWKISSERFLISNSPYASGRFDAESTQDFVRGIYPDSTGQILFGGRPGKGVALLDIHSAKQDEYLDQIYRGLKEGATQFSGNRPAALIAAIVDLPSHYLEMLGRNRGNNSFVEIAGRLFGGSTRSHLHSVVFTGEPAIQRKLDGSFNSGGISLNFVNPNHPLRFDSRLRLVR